MHDKKVITQKDIADSLGISRGTVDRALHDRKGISREVRDLILRRAEQLGYAPNKFAQFLVTGKQIHLAIISPADPFWAKVHEGADSFQSELGGWLVQIKWFETEVHDPDREIALFHEALAAGVDGIGIVPADPDLLAPLIDRAVDEGIPIVTLNTDAPQSRRLVFIGQDSELAGRLAAELLGKFCQGSGRAIVITGFPKVLVHKHRLASFLETMASDFPGISIVGVYEGHDTEREAYEITRRVLAEREDLTGIYLTTGTGVGGVGRALKEVSKAGRIKVVCYDFVSDTVELLRDGTVTASIGEDPYGQGYQTVKALYDYIVDKKMPTGSALYTRIDIGLRANIGLLAS